MKEEILVDVGLSRNEARVYLALLEAGSATANEVSKLSGVHRTNVYDSLNGLIKKGVVSFLIKDKTKYYEAADPKNLMSVLKEKESILEKIIPELSLSKKFAPSRDEVHLFTGIRAIKDLLNHFLEMGVSRCVYGAPRMVAERVGIAWLDEYHKKRAKKKMFLRHIYNEDAYERVKYLNTLPYTETRCLPKKYDSPVATEVCGNEVILILWTEKEPIAIQIINEKIATAYQRYFELLWKIAKKP